MAEIIKLDDIRVAKEDMAQIQSIHGMKQFADNFEISNQQTYEVAAMYLGDIASHIRKLGNLHKKLKAPIIEAGRNIDSMFKHPIETGKEARKILQNKMLTFVSEIEKQQRSIQDEANRLAMEVKQHAEDEALFAMAKGDDAKAKRILDELDVMPAPINNIESPSAQGVSTRSNWKCRVVDLNKLIQAVAQGKAPLSLITADLPACNKYAKAVRNTLKIDGLEFYNDVTLAVRK